VIINKHQLLTDCKKGEKEAAEKQLAWVTMLRVMGQQGLK
jgi:hypothetical protein